MIAVGDRVFREVWLVDFEFSAPPGERPAVVCLVAWEVHSGQKLRLWQDALYAMEGPPYAVNADTLFVAYYASAEMGCHWRSAGLCPPMSSTSSPSFVTSPMVSPCPAGPGSSARSAGLV